MIEKRARTKKLSLSLRCGFEPEEPRDLPWSLGSMFVNARGDSRELEEETGHLRDARGSGLVSVENDFHIFNQGHC